VAGARRLYRVAVGVGSGAATGWLLGKLLFDWPRGNALAKTESGVIAFAGVLLAYGATELLEGYGFIAAFVAGPDPAPLAKAAMSSTSACTISPNRSSMR
jgi:NhaP-type Na+/H+ or K+/H+ antiporter